MSFEHLTLEQVKLYIQSSFKYVPKSIIERLSDKGKILFEYRENLYKIFIIKAREEQKEQNKRKVRFFEKVLEYDYDDENEKNEEEKILKNHRKIIKKRGKYLNHKKSRLSRYLPLSLKGIR